MKLYFAGMEQMTNSYHYEPKLTDNIFGTFFYEKNTSQMLREMKQTGHIGIKTIDSGAHSFFGYAGISTQSHHNKKSANKDQMPCPIKYFDRYLSWLWAYRDHYDYFVELDIQAIVGIEKVKYWRRKLERQGLWDKCIPVLHSCDTPAQWDETIKSAASKYVGFEGLRKHKVNIPYTELLAKCYSMGVRVHGFALTNFAILEQYPFWSADSTTWTSCLRYGSFIATDKFGAIAQKAPTKKNYTKHSADLNLHNSKRDDPLYKLAYSAMKLRESEEFLTKIWLSRGVDWDGVLDPKDRAASRSGLELQEGHGRP